MPFDNDAQPMGLMPQLPEPAAVNTPAPPWSKLFETSLERDNPWVSMAQSATQPGMAPFDPNYDPFRNLAGYEDYASSFVGANTDEDVAHIKTRIDSERRHEQLLADGGWRGTVAAIGAGLADPLMLGPVGGELVAVTRTGRALAGALRTGATFGAVTAAQEALLHGSQITRNPAESAINVAMSTVLGGVIGGAAGVITRDVARSAMHAGETFERELSANTGGDPLGMAAGAAAAPRYRAGLDELAIADALGIPQALARTSPTLRLGTSPSAETRRIALELADQPLDIRMNAEGVPTPISVERRIMQAQGPLAEAMQGLDDAFVQYRLGRDRQPLDIARLGARDLIAGALGRDRTMLTYDEFKEAIGRAMRRGDVSDIPEVAEAARLFRQKVFDPLKDKAIAAGLLPADVMPEGAVSYFSRVYNSAKISANRTAFEKILTDWLNTTSHDPSLTQLDLKDIARQVTDQLMNMGPNRSSYGGIVPLARGPLKGRTLAIPDELIEDYLEHDVGHIARKYTRTMASDTELTRAFGRADMQEQLDKVREHYAVLREAAQGDRAVKALNDREAADLRDLAAIRDRVRGTYGLPDNPNGLWNRTYHVLKDLNYLRLLGGMTVSAFPDIGRTVMTHGLSRVLGDGILPMLRDFGRYRLASNEVKLAGNALDMVLDTRAMSLADMMDDYGRWSKYERGLKGMTERFGLVTLMAPWNAALKQFVGVVSQTRSLQAIEKLAGGGVLRPAERTRLASLGIGEEMAGHINEMFAAHGSKEGAGAWWANTSAWTDQDAADAFRAAMSKEVDTAIVTPGQERPLWTTSGNTWRLIGQFHSFSLASTQRVMMTGLQKRDMATLNGALIMVGLGSMAFWLQRAVSPDAPPLPDLNTPEGWAQLLREGVDKSGLLGWLFDVHNMVEKASRGGVGLSRLTGGPPMSRYASRGVVESLLGPTVGLAEAGATALGSAGAGEWAGSDTKAVRRMLPMQNLIYLRWLFDAAEAGLNRNLGVPEQRARG